MKSHNTWEAPSSSLKSASWIGTTSMRIIRASLESSEGMIFSMALPYFPSTTVLNLIFASVESKAMMEILFRLTVILKLLQPGHSMHNRKEVLLITSTLKKAFTS